VSNAVDLGFRLGSSGVEFQTKFLLTSRSSPLVNVSLNPLVNGFVWFGASGTSGPGGLVGFQLPVLIGFNTGNGSEIVLGPRLIDLLLFGVASTASGTRNILLAGGSVGWNIRLTDHFRMHPEVGVVFPLLGMVNSTGTLATGGFTLAGIGLQASLGLQFGN
jgi:hypothetical protein